MKVIIVGGVAAGMSAATRLRRLDESAEIIVVEAGEHVSYANCGLPYYAGGVITKRDALLLQTPESLHARFRLDVRTRERVTAIDTAAKSVTIAVATGDTYTEDYDSLVLSPGASPILPPIPGIEQALTLRDVSDVDALVAQLPNARSAVVIGAGFVGLEVAENLSHRGIGVTVVELAPQVLAPLDAEMAIRVRDRMAANGATIHTSAQVTRLGATTATVLGPGGEQQIPADVVIAAIGVRPETSLARAAGLELSPQGGILVDENLRTSAPDVFAVGDAASKRDALGAIEATTLIPLANLANRHGRHVADVIAGREAPMRASIGTAVVGVFGLTAATTGRNERRLLAEGRDFEVIHAHPAQHAGYYPGATPLALKLLVDSHTDQILGAQAVGEDGADKRIDVIATAMMGGIRASELTDLELAYAPAYGSAKDPVNMLGYIADNRRYGDSPSVQWHELDAMVGHDGAVVVDVRSAAEHAGGTVEVAGSPAINIPLDELRTRASELPSKVKLVVHCQVGQRGNTATRLLRQMGYDAVNLDGGYLTWRDGTRAGSSVAAV
ncbi:FAD-dependent oxidoreductase [Demequina aurantiaca]|uniref:FAD-dependent oxidoreductase n=1 Tax=Demequina aurantiaca TaxID=676200 RepID=UPI000A02DC82|nr:FAD-dependent oxidoreductase [Demequina aurantiaca]